MRVAALTVQLHLPWVHSLKEKRMTSRSIMSKLRNRFNISVAETDRQDDHAFLVVSLAAIAASPTQADSILDNALRFIEGATEAEVQVLQRDIL